MRVSVDRVRWFLLKTGVLILLSVYYLNYAIGFYQGTTANAGPLALVLRLISISMISVALAPYQIRWTGGVLLVALYSACFLSFLFAAGTFGTVNDALFLNTLIQLPVLLALCFSRAEIDFGKLFRFMTWVVLAQASLDGFVMSTGESLWLSRAFIGGVGNPSSFGLICVILLAFNLFYPSVGRWRALKVSILAIAAVLSKSLFSVMGVVIVFGVWSSLRGRRFLAATGCLTIILLTSSYWIRSVSDDVFIVHKLLAAAAFVGLANYDVSSSATVSVRADMHARTFAAIADQPVAVLTGHLQGKAYWPMDSQVLTYLGSFGAILLFMFLLLHVVWIACAWKHRSRNGNFAVVALGMYMLIFFTNRILDYFPMATIYFMLIAMSLNQRHVARPGRKARLSTESMASNL